ncbi:unnamed protein product [Adineta ricciae]|uniref:ADP ribosyltransferase domain-containing protein n=1 Tax=Adineta ricciae TaxID=249248 RepID=A0A814IUT8_ADIRI|nr:unnamed protein product [Adineta ricciae]CAF1180092.1 unnamed protein product [Adineta ricciae]
MDIENRSNISNYNVIWLDKSIHSKQNANLQDRLRSIVTHLQVFEDVAQCEQYIQSTFPTNQFIFIVSGKLGQEIIPRIHEYSTIYMIYVYCVNKDFYQVWSLEYPKIKGIYNHFEGLLELISSYQRRRVESDTNESFSMSILNGTMDNEQSTSHMDGRFVHSQLLTDCLLRMQTIVSDTDKEDLINLCLEKYPDASLDISKYSEDFTESYSADSAIYWYTKEAFVYRLLNKSLRTQDIDLLFAFRFLIRDIQQHLQEYQCLSPVTLYRSQLILDEELEILKQSVGKLISMNSFLSTTTEHDIAWLSFTSPNPQNASSRNKSVIFQIYADPSRTGMKPFANVSEFSAFPDENEVLMMLGSVFRLDRIHLGQYHTWVIEMTLCSDDDHDLKAVVDSMRSQYGSGQTRLLLFGHVLVDMARFHEAEKYYYRLLKQLSDDDPDVSLCYHSLAKVACEKGAYELSLKKLQRALDIAQRTLRKNHPRLGFIYTSMGEVYEKIGKTNEALDSYKKALKVWSKYQDLDPQYIAWCLNNIGNVYNTHKEYSKALEYLTKAMKMKNSCLPPSHPCMGNAYLNLGNSHYYSGQYQQAVQCYQTAKNIYTTSLPPDHPSIATTLKNIGLVYETEDNLSEAMICYEKALSIRQKSPFQLHTDVIEAKRDVKRISLKLKKDNNLQRTLSSQTEKN